MLVSECASGHVGTVRRLVSAVLLTSLALPTSVGAAAPTGAVLGTPVTVPVSIKHTGKKKAKASTTAIVLSKDARRGASDTVLVRAKTPSLRPGKTAKLAPKITVPASVAPGIYKLLVCPSFTKRCRVLVKTFTVTAAPTPQFTPVVVPPAGPAPPGVLPATPNAPPATPAAPTPPPTTPAPTTPAPTTPAPAPTTPPGPKTGLEIAPNPIRLGALSSSATTEEWVAATRLVSITNHGPGGQSIGPYFRGYQSGVVTSTQVANSPQDVPGKSPCGYGQKLAEGATCWVRLFWHPANASQGVPLTGNLQGRFGVEVPNTTTDLASVPVSADLTSRSFIEGGVPLFDGRSGYSYRAQLTLRNVGDVPGGYTIEKSGPHSDLFFQDPTRPGQNTCDGNLNPGETCTIPYRFCASAALPEDERYRATLTIIGDSQTTTVDLVARNLQTTPPQLCGSIFDE